MVEQYKLLVLLRLHQLQNEPSLKQLGYQNPSFTQLKQHSIQIASFIQLDYRGKVIFKINIIYSDSDENGQNTNVNLLVLSVFCTIIFKMSQLSQFDVFTPIAKSQHNVSSQFNHDSPAIHSQFGKKFEIEPNRQLSNLYNYLCEEKLPPKEILTRVKSAEKVCFRNNEEDLLMITKPTKISLQQKIVLSSYKSLLKNQFHTRFERQREITDFHLRYREMANQNQTLLEENRKLKRQFIKLKNKEKSNELKIQELEETIRQLNDTNIKCRRQQKQNSSKLKVELKKLRKDKQDYQSLIDALKESIHILKGKQIKDVSQIWKEWKHIFELASLQQCKLKNKVAKS